MDQGCWNDKPPWNQQYRLVCHHLCSLHRLHFNWELQGLASLNSPLWIWSLPPTSSVAGGSRAPEGPKGDVEVSPEDLRLLEDPLDQEGEGHIPHGNGHQGTLLDLDYSSSSDKSSSGSGSSYPDSSTSSSSDPLAFARERSLDSEGRKKTKRTRTSKLNTSPKERRIANSKFSISNKPRDNRVI